MLNHKTGHNSARLYYPENSDSDGFLKMRALLDIGPNQELYNTYKDRPNCEMLIQYGFVEEDNPLDIVEIELDRILEHCKNCSIFKQKLKFLQLNDVLEDAFVIDRSGSIPHNMEFVLQLFHMNEREWQCWKDELAAKSKTVVMFSECSESGAQAIDIMGLRKISDEKGMQKTLLQILKSKLKDYPSLKNTLQPFALQAAQLLQHSEKLIIKMTMEKLKTMS